MQRTSLILLVLAIALTSLPGLAGEGSRHDDPADKRARIDAVARKTLNRLFEDAPRSKEVFDEAVGYAVFSSLKFALGLSGGGGSGVAVNKASEDRTYMRMGTAGLGLSIGGKKYRVIFFFENEEVFDRFVEKGWQADTSASATAGTAGAGVASTFTEGLAIYQFSKKGLMAQAEIAGTKYWKAEGLN